MASQSLVSITELLDRYTFEFIEDVPERLKCILCDRVLRNAKQTSCGCKVCEKCISDYLKNSEKPCPAKCVDSKLMLARDVHQDNATNKEIANLKVKCPFKSCDFVDTLRMMLVHIDDCEYREIICLSCNKVYSFKEKYVHDKDQCDKRIVECPYCYEHMAAILYDTVHLNVDHFDLCSKYNGDCGNDCGATNVNLKEHMKKCTSKKVECPFTYFQCRVGKLTTVNLMKHLQEELAPHLTNVISEIEEIKKDNDTLKGSVNRLETIIKEQNQTIKKLTEGRIKTDKSIEELKLRSSGTASSSEKLIIFRNAGYVWKISNFESIKSEAENGVRASVTSEAFYTSEFGYKMCLRVYPAGDGVGRGTHLSVFFAIMKGDYDDILTWPFKQKVTLSLVDQENYGAKNHTDTFKPDARSACYQKPIDDCNIASGSPKFLPLSSLSAYSMFCKNDTVYIKISVDTIGITKP